MTDRQDDVAVHVPAEADAEEEEIGQKVFEIVPGDAIGYPGAVMVKARHAPIARRAMLRPQRPPHQARETKVTHREVRVCAGGGGGAVEQGA